MLHESGELFDTSLDLATLLECALSDGVSWLEVYTDEVSAILASDAAAVPLSMHLHWTTPLVLGGRAHLDNVSFVDRAPHLVGHHQLWSQIGGLPPGASLRVR